MTSGDKADADTNDAMDQEHLPRLLGAVAARGGFSKNCTTTLRQLRISPKKRPQPSSLGSPLPPQGKRGIGGVALMPAGATCSRFYQWDLKGQGKATSLFILSPHALAASAFKDAHGETSHRGPSF